MPIRLEPIEIGGTIIWVEIDDKEFLTSIAAEKTAKTASSSTSLVVNEVVKADIAKTLLTIVRPIHDALAMVAPKEFIVELSLGLKGEVGVFVARSEGNASMKVTAKWIFE